MRALTHTVHVAREKVRSARVSQVRGAQSVACNSGNTLRAPRRQARLDFNPAARDCAIVLPILAAQSRLARLPASQPARRIARFLRSLARLLETKSQITATNAAHYRQIHAHSHAHTQLDSTTTTTTTQSATTTTAATITACKRSRTTSC